MRLHKVHVGAGFFLQTAVLILMFPLPWVVAMLIAGAVHEIGHLVALKAMKIPVCCLRIQVGGAYLETSSMSMRQETIASLAGPIFGLGLLLFSRWAPRVAFCGAIHGLYNLIPIYPYDGGRTLAGVLFAILPVQIAIIAYRIVKWVFCIAVSGFCLWLYLFLRLGYFVLLPGLILLIKAMLSEDPSLDNFCLRDKLAIETFTNGRQL